MDYTGGAFDSPLHVYVFGDQTNAFESDLNQLLHVKDCEVLSSFFEQVNYALRLEISRLPASQKKWFPRFTSIIDLLARYAESESNPALGLALLCLNQLARFINHYTHGSSTYPNSSDSCVIGLCTGSLAAAAISTSQTVFELLPAAREAVLIAFRTGLRSIEVRNDLEQSLAGAPTTWSVAVGMHEQQAVETLNAFSAVKGYSRCAQPYLSAVTPTSVTISGPPKVLEDLLSTVQFSSIKPIQLSVHAPYHAFHLYDSNDVDAILASSDTEVLESYLPRIPLISCTTGREVKASSYGLLLRAVLTDILIEQLRWDNVLNNCAKNIIKGDIPYRCNIYPVLTNVHSSQSLANVLSQSFGKGVGVLDAAFSGDLRSPSTRAGGKSEQAKIAIVGFSGRFPDAESNGRFWDLLHKGLDVHREIPPDRFDVKAHFDPTGKTKNTSRVQYGCWIKEPGLFDARFFNMSPREAAQADPAQRLAITTAYEAMEMAGFVPDRTPSSQRDRVGIFYGTTSDDWREVNSGQNVDTYFIPGGNRAFTPGRINYHFKFSGPSFSIDTACSSSFAALHTACNSLWRGDCDTAIAGGTNVMTNPDNFAGLDRGHFLSTTGNCNTFDDDANGYCRADAVGTVILKRLEDAEADKDPIYGVLLGAYTNHSAEADSMTRPHVGAQAFIFNKMLRNANIDPLDISYIEMHGTGTQTGDAVEMKSVLDVFARSPRDSQHSLHLGSAKANVGHAESASGVTSLIKVLLMMQHNEIPPHCGIKTKINHGFPTDLKSRNVNIAMESIHWARPSTGNHTRTVFMNNFSAAGGNTALLMEDAPLAKLSDKMEDVRSCHIVAISSKSIASVQRNIEAMVKLIDDRPDLSLPALSYTTTARRMHHSYRITVSGNDLACIKESLQCATSFQHLKPIPTKTPDVVFVFTGQGSMYAGMGRQLFERISSFRADIYHFDSIAQRQGFPSILPLIQDSSASLEELGPVATQLGTMCVQMALARLWASWGIFPSAVVGHSLGEYAALHIAGVISASDAILLTGTRAQMLVQRCTMGTHAMLAVKSSLATVMPHLVGTGCEIACINAAKVVVVSGKLVEIDALSTMLTPLGLECIKLEVPFAFHSAQVEPILQDFEAAAQGAVFHKPAIPFISPLLSGVVNDEKILGPSYLSQSCRRTVDFLGGLEAAKTTGIVNDKTLWVEIGSHPICSGMIKATFGSQIVALPSLRRNTDVWKVVAESVSVLHKEGLEIQWNEYHRDFEGSHQVLQLPAYQWDSKNHWIQYNNNFCLTKGDNPALATVAPGPSVLATTSVQRMIEHSFGSDKSTVLVESDLSDPLLSQVVQSHKVNGVALCPSSLWADVALTLGDYLLKESQKNASDFGMAVSDMVVEKPLIATGKGLQLFRASASVDWKSMRADVSIFSVTSEGKKIVDHAKCVLRYENSKDWLGSWKRTNYLIRSRIRLLQQSVDDVQVHKIKRGLTYKLFSSFVEYGPCFQGMQETLFDSSQLEATALVTFQSTEKDGTFYFSPYWIDSLGHIAGFMMNATECIDWKNLAYVNHGWDNMRCATKFSPEKSYRTYVRMINIGGTMYSGDVYIFDEDTVVGVYEGVKFQGIPRQVIDQLLPSGKTSTPVSTASVGPVSHPQAGRVESLAYSESLQVVPKPNEALSKKTNIMFRVLAIVAEEIGVAVSELSSSTQFASLGVDSLMSLTITGRLREELDLEVSSSLFADCETVKALSQFLGVEQDSNFSTSPSPPSTDSFANRLTPQTGSLSDRSGYMTDETEVDVEDTASMSVISRILAEEIGVSADELAKCHDFGELGLDSLMSLTVLGILREELNMELPPGLFADNKSLSEVAAALGLTRQDAVSLSGSSTVPVPRATSILLQGHPKTASKVLFLFPDGSGSATSYARLPHISPDIAVYGLNCPYQKIPEEFRSSLERITTPYLEEIRRRQPRGPYYFGGWSAGGISAFDAAQELERSGETVARLILIDSPFPIGLEKLPPRLYDFFGSIGMFGSSQGKAPPKWLIPHFLAFVDSLDKYRAKPFAPGRGPKTYIVWAKDGVCKEPEDPRPEPRDDDPKEMKWLLENRTDFGPNGWDALLGRDDVAIETLDNANHFTMMEGETVIELAGFIGRAMA